MPRVLRTRRAPLRLSLFLLFTSIDLLGSRAALADLVVLPAPVAADPPASVTPLRFPTAVAERPITYPRFVLASSIVFDVLRVDATESYADLTGQVNFGITDDLMVRALVFPLQLSGPAGDGFHYGQTSQTHGPSVGATYRLVRGRVEIGVGLDLRVFTSEGLTGGAIISIVPIRIHASKSVRVDVNPQLNITRATKASVSTEIVNAAATTTSRRPRAPRRTRSASTSPSA